MENGKGLPVRRLYGSVKEKKVERVEGDREEKVHEEN